jgi:ADP-heptose:LPS heptosyltransferase
VEGSYKVAVFRALQLGDMLCVVPALRALRAAMPQAHITLIGLPWARQFGRRFKHYVDACLDFPGFPGLPETAPVLEAIPQFLATVQRERFDLLLQIHGSGILSNPLCAAFGARRMAGFYRRNHYCPELSRYLPWNEQEHEILRYLRLMDFLGIATCGSQLEFPLFRSDFHALQQDILIVPAPATYACIHPGARLPSRRWPPHRFAEIADRLAAAGLQVIITGTAQEADVTRAVLAAMRMPAIDLTGKTELGALAALVADARLLICNDTGVSHIAAAVRTPSVVICSGADPLRWAPLDVQLHRLLFQPVDCRPCMHFSCPLPGHPCATGVSVESAWRAARDLLDSPVPDRLAAREGIIESTDATAPQ